MIKKTATINDISGYGRCSLSVALPILSAMNIQCCSVPTAVLSNHTGYNSYFFEDCSNNIVHFLEEWKKLNLSFDSIYSGFLGSSEQIDMVKDFISSFNSKIVLVDPVMADGGKVYSTYTDEMCQKMKTLVSVSTITTPNVTEACILSDTKYIGEEISFDDALKMAERIRDLGSKNVVITGIRNKDRVCNLVLSNDKCKIFSTKASPVYYSGTGDVFASLLCGFVTNGFDIFSSVKRAAKLVAKMVRYSKKAGIDPHDGICIEHFVKGIL